MDNTIQGIAGEDVKKGDLLIVNVTDGKFYKAIFIKKSFWSSIINLFSKIRRK